MQEKRNKLRLRKWVLIATPIALCITVFIVGLIIYSNHALTIEQESTEVASSNFVPIEVIENNEPGILSQNSFIKDLDKRMERNKIDYTIVFYANKYKLNIPKVLEIAHNLTNDYEDEQYKKDFIISPANIKNQFGPYKNMEAGIVEYIREIYRYPEKFGSSLDEIRASEEVTTERQYSDSGHIILDNGLTFEQFLKKMCELYDLNPNIALGIVYEETGRMTSGLFTYNNNIGGQRGYAGWLEYPTLEAGVIGFVVSLNNLYENNGISKDDPNGLYALSSIYVHGSMGNPSSDWTGKVNIFAAGIQETNQFEEAR